MCFGCFIIVFRIRIQESFYKTAKFDIKRREGKEKYQGQMSDFCNIANGIELCYTKSWHG